MSVFGPYPAVVLDVHDGDTARVDLDCGFGIHQVAYSCRIFGINAPELATDAGKIARAYALTLMKPGDRVSVLSHGWDAYSGRFDGDIKLLDGSDFATRMVDSGNAIWKTYK